jgi:hypothetical protein
LEIGISSTTAEPSLIIAACPASEVVIVATEVDLGFSALEADMPGSWVVGSSLSDGTVVTGC